MIYHDHEHLLFDRSKREAFADEVSRTRGPSLRRSVGRMAVRLGTILVKAGVRLQNRPAIS